MSEDELFENTYRLMMPDLDESFYAEVRARAEQKAASKMAARALDDAPTPTSEMTKWEHRFPSIEVTVTESTSALDRLVAAVGNLEGSVPRGTLLIVVDDTDVVDHQGRFVGCTKPAHVERFREKPPVGLKLQTYCLSAILGNEAFDVFPAFDVLPAVATPDRKSHGPLRRKALQLSSALAAILPRAMVPERLAAAIRSYNEEARLLDVQSSLYQAGVWKSFQDHGGLWGFELASGTTGVREALVKIETSTSPVLAALDLVNPAGSGVLPFTEWLAKKPGMPAAETTPISDGVVVGTRKPCKTADHDDHLRAMLLLGGTISGLAAGIAAGGDVASSMHPTLEAGGDAAVRSK